MSLWIIIAIASGVALCTAFGGVLAGIRVGRRVEARTLERSHRLLQQRQDEVRGKLRQAEETISACWASHVEADHAKLTISSLTNAMCLLEAERDALRRIATSHEITVRWPREEEEEQVEQVWKERQVIAHPRSLIAHLLSNLDVYTAASWVKLQILQNTAEGPWKKIYFAKGGGSQPKGVPWIFQGTVAQVMIAVQDWCYSTGGIYIDLAGPDDDEAEIFRDHIGRRVVWNSPDGVFCWKISLDVTHGREALREPRTHEVQVAVETTTVRIVEVPVVIERRIADPDMIRAMIEVEGCQQPSTAAPLDLSSGGCSS